MNSGRPVIAVPAPGDDSGRGYVAPLPHWVETRSPQEICAAHGSPFVPPSPLDKVAVSLGTLNLQPLNARRVSPERGICGWYIWGGGSGRNSRAAGFFETMPVAHLLERCPQIMPFLALAPGWWVSIAPGGPEILPPHDAAPPPNVAVRRIGALTSRTPPVKQWVWLSILLHILAVVLFGDTTGGGSRSGTFRGEKTGGPITVTLQPAAPVRAEPLALRPATHLGSLSRAEKLAQSQPANLSPTTSNPPPANDAAPADALAPAPARDAAPVMPPVIAIEVEKPATDFVVPVATSAPMRTPDPVPPAPIPPPEPPSARLPSPLPLPKLDTLPAPKAIATPIPERNVALPAELIPRLTPLVPARSERSAPLETAPRAKTFVPPKIEPDAPPVELPRMTPLAPLAPATVERERLRAPELLPRLPPVAPSATFETAKPTDVVPRVAQPVTAPVATEVATEKTPVTTPAPPVSTITPVPSNASPSVSSPPSRATAGPSLDTTNRGDSLPAPDPRSAITSPPGRTAPPINLDSLRQRVREIDREGSAPRTLLPFNVKPKLDTRTKEQQAFDKALKRTDCRDAYADMGLAAVLPLILDTVSEKGCKW